MCWRQPRHAAVNVFDFGYVELHERGCEAVWCSSSVAQPTGMRRTERRRRLDERL